MKKGLLLAASMLSIFGTFAVAHASAPTVSVGAAQSITLPTSSVTLSGTAAFAAPATALASTTWSFTSGPATPVIATPSALSTSVSGLTVAGSYVFTLTAVDNVPVTPFTNAATVTVTVNPATVNPTVSAGADQIITGTTATLTGTATAVSPSTIATYAWTQISGPASTITTPASASTTVTGLSVGTYTYSLAVTDSANHTASDTVNISVGMNQNPLPVVPLKKMRININEAGKVDLIGTLDTINGTVLTIKAFGISFTVNAANANFTGPVKDFSLYKVGDIISVQGSIDPSATTLTINARNVRDMNITGNKDRMNREKERKHEDEMNKQDDNWFPSLDAHNQKHPKFEGGPTLNGNGNGNGNGKGEGRGRGGDN